MPHWLAVGTHGSSTEVLSVPRPGISNTKSNTHSQMLLRVIIVYGLRHGPQQVAEIRNIYPGGRLCATALH